MGKKLNVITHLAYALLIFELLLILFGLYVFTITTFCIILISIMVILAILLFFVFKIERQIDKNRKKDRV